eukprot:TRINITY_DN18815_c0_g1_i2.p1 TRINITY_DN18815_c0_g1~~TRINITY_DN18815_c0_g1_i2.p1  ORF type:complete len:474 (+),score=116.03 TRINITY_DN18815_c0_g1_i2:994-2415(+)
MKVDVNRLRKETYNDESRIPVEIQPGSELDDVIRRDFTINALYYNIITEQVEDLLNTGLQDLQNRIIRTPGDPKESICEDPLRIFRAIRFAARFDFALHEDLVSVIRDYPAPLILKKVSRERIAQEVFKALLISSDLGCALRTVVFLQELNLFAMVFEPKIVLDSGKQLPVSPEEFQWTDDLISESVECVRGVVSARPSFNSSGHKKVSRERIAQEVFKALLISSDLGCALRTVVFLQELNLFAMVFEPKIVLDSGKQLPVSPEEFQWTDDLISESVECVRGVVSARPSFNSRTFVLAAILWPIRNHEYELKKNKLRPLAEALLQYNCKQPIAIINEVIQILSAAQAFHALLKDFPADASSESKADVVFSNCGLETRVGHILRKSKEDWILALLIASRGYSHVSASLAKWIREESGLDGVWEWKPFFAGGALKELGVEGPQIGKFIEHQWEWRFSNPTASQQDCLNWLQTLLT